MSGGDRETTYQQWMKQEGLPIHSGHGIRDVREVELGPWARLGGRGAFIQLVGMEGLTGMYIGEIPPGGSLEPERHMFEELIYILSGRGATQVWGGGRKEPDGAPHAFEWQTGSFFAPPMNTWHTLLNGSGSEPVRFMVATNAPLVLDLYHNPKFVFGCDYVFDDRYAGENDYFHVGDRKLEPDGKTQWFTNFIPDVPGATIDRFERNGRGTKGSGVRLTSFDIAGNVLVGHLSEGPGGRYQKAHHHMGGAILYVIKSRGYTLMWPVEAGTRPYESGRADEVVRVDWQPGSVFSPPTGWFHQHFNTDSEPVRQLGMRYGSHLYGVQFQAVRHGKGNHVSVKDGGTAIEYEDEDPELRLQFLKALAENGVECTMDV